MSRDNVLSEDKYLQPACKLSELKGTAYILMLLNIYLMKRNDPGKTRRFIQK